MINNEYIDKLHAELLTIMDEVDRICQKNGLKYYLCSGTLLGAIRHKGFIPWDDDMDFIMPREDFNRFISIFASEASEGYSLNWISTNENYWRLHAKVEKKNTKFVEELGHGYTSDSGIFVDIFVLDDAIRRDKSTLLRAKLVKKIAIMISCKAAPGALHGPKKWLVDVIPNKKLFSIAERLSTKKNNKGGKFYARMSSTAGLASMVVEKDAFGDGTVLSFEGREYRVPTDYIAVVKSYFGDDYMTLPPEDQRRTHYPLHVTFSDGTTLDFEPAKNKVKH